MYHKHAPPHGLAGFLLKTSYHAADQLPSGYFCMRTHVSSVGLLIRSDRADDFSYPSHIARADIDALPPRPGIYIFRGQGGAPLYVGKSVNIRARVLSHLRTPEEARMLRQTARIDFERTAGEIGALLLESQLIKQWQPAFNRKLRRTREMCGFMLRGATPEVVFARDIDFASTDGLYGLFASRRGALEALRDIVERHQLCPAVTGLESPLRGRPCFARQLARCRGACVGHESADEHASRLRAALETLRVMAWPYDGAVGIVEQCDGWRQTQLVDRWCYLGALDSPARPVGARAEPRFDIDTYQILVKPMLLGRLTIDPMGRSRRDALLAMHIEQGTEQQSTPGLSVPGR